MLNNSYLLLDASALRDNVRSLREELGAAALVPVIKDDAYGLGAVSVAQILTGCGVDTFAVSHVSEGLILREAGIRSTIWLLSIPLDRHLLPAVEAGLIPPLASFRQFELLKKAAQTLGKPIPVQLKLDSGLHRIGFTEAELSELIRTLPAYAPWLDIVGTFSHFSDNAPETMERQFALFRRMTEALHAAGIDPGLRHISSSASLEADTKYNLDAVRIGRRLYMDNPDKPTGRIREAASFRAYLTDIRQRQAGDSLAYGDSFHLAADTRVGVLSVGYGDGLDLNLFRCHAPVLINGQRAGLLECCMDQSFVDLSGVDCEVGDEVTFFGYDGRGHFLSAQEVASAIGANEGCALTGALTLRVARRTVNG